MLTDPSVSLRRVVTHPGGAHKDDLLACCVLIARHGCPIERREPTEADLDDPRVAVVDVGGDHDAARQNFDHHHFARDHAPTCALSLVLASLGVYDDARTFCDWLEPAEWFDSRGPKKTAAWLGVPRKAISQLHSPIDGTLLRRFAAGATHRPGEVVYDYMKLVGEDLIAYLTDVRAGIERVRAIAERWQVEAHGEVVEAVFVPRAADALSDPSGSAARFARAEGIDDVLGATVYPDRRGAGYGIARYEDDPRLDFCRVEGEPDVRFAHKSGFVCKTDATDPVRLRQLIAAAVIPGVARS